MKGIPRTPGSIARAALASFGAIAAGVTVIAVVESYSDLLAFARAYGLSGWRAAIAPGAVDSFIVLGELLLFAAILLAWGRAPRILGLAMAAWGFLLSVGGNIWHAVNATVADRAVSAIWPVTATAALAGALLIVQQVTVTSGAPVPPGGAGAEPPPAPVASAEPPARVARRSRRPAAAVDEQALLEELLSASGPLPSYRAWSFEKTGMYRTAATKRVHDKAKMQLNGAGHD